MHLSGYLIYKGGSFQTPYGAGLFVKINIAEFNEYLPVCAEQQSACPSNDKIFQS
jgi:hypothetical protein